MEFKIERIKSVRVAQKDKERAKIFGAPQVLDHIVGCFMSWRVVYPDTSLGWVRTKRTVIASPLRKMIAPRDKA